MLKHTSFLTRDLAATLAFYTLLGGTVEKDLLTHEGHRRGVVRLEKTGPLLLGWARISVTSIDERTCEVSWSEHIRLRATSGAFLSRAAVIMAALALRR